MKGGKPSAEGVSQFIGRFRELIEGIMDHLAGQSFRLYPQSALSGSIKIKFSTDSNDNAIEALKSIDRVLRSSTEFEFRKQLLEYNIDPSQLKEFLTSTLRNSFNVEITPKLASDGETIELLPDRIRQCVEYLAHINYIIIDSIKVPQANDIDKVLEVVKLINDGTPLIPENIDGVTTGRQVKYYTDAAYALGLTTKDKQVTAAGHFIISHSEKVDQYEILANRFESTDFGWAWMRWAQVQYMTDLDPKSAADFLIDSAPDLSEVTARRRASTLEQWLIKLKPYHRKYKPQQV